jgi:hypothetical protein
MKVMIKYINSDVPKENYSFFDDFIKYLQKKYPLKKDLTVIFVGDRKGSMTSGQRNDKGELLILTKDRMNRDILRTLAHEWYHEYDRTVLKNPKGPDIGGHSEDDANAEAGKVLKQYEKSNPKNEKKMYK